jgi:MFS transporter, DHA1 family, tetracycline resistance protein
VSSESSPRKPALGFIFVTLVLLIIGFGIIVPVLPQLVTNFSGGSVAEGSSSFGLIVGIFALMQFVCSPILGSLSDRYGRRKVILIALAGSGIDYVVTGFAQNMTWLFVARIISGMTAGTLATCNAYIADVTPPEKRAQAYGMVGAAFGLGFVLGPALGGILGKVSIRLPFFVAAGCVGVNWLYGLFVLPESLAREHRRPFSWARANPVGSLLALRKFHGVGNLAVVHFIYMFASSILQSTWVLYMGYRYGWTTLEVGLSLTFIGIMSVVVQGALVKRIIARTGERRGLVLGLLITAIAMAGYGSASRSWVVYGIIVVGAFGGITGPAAQALITKHVSPGEQGAVQGALSGLTSLASIFAPILGAHSFAMCIPPDGKYNLPGVAFFEAALLSVVALVFAELSFRSDDREGLKA